MKEGEERILVGTMEMHKPSLHKINEEWDMEVSMTRSGQDGERSQMESWRSQMES